MFPNFPQAFIQKNLRKGLIQVNQNKVTAAYRFTGEEEVTIAPLLLEASPKPLPQPPSVLSPEQEQWLESLILWEDDEMLVLNKPAGLAVQGGTKTFEHVDGLLAAYGALKKQRYRLVHRLDRDTTGVLLLAKKAETARYLTNQFRLNAIKKLYLAVVAGRWQPHTGIINTLVAKVHSTGKIAVVEERGREAVTSFRLLKHLKNDLSLMAFYPETGRTHQLRVHAQFHGYPIIGDNKYGYAAGLSFPLHLHAYRLKVIDREGAELVFTAPLPDYFEETLRKHGGDAHKLLENI
jgi:23S rRNA pseudouridine955/2504/2580 synthase